MKFNFFATTCLFVACCKAGKLSAGDLRSAKSLLDSATDNLKLWSEYVKLIGTQNSLGEQNPIGSALLNNVGSFFMELYSILNVLSPKGQIIKPKAEEFFPTVPARAANPVCGDEAICSSACANSIVDKARAGLKSIGAILRSLQPGKEVPIAKLEDIEDIILSVFGSAVIIGGYLDPCIGKEAKAVKAKLSDPFSPKAIERLVINGLISQPEYAEGIEKAYVVAANDFPNIFEYFEEEPEEEEPVIEA